MTNCGPLLWYGVFVLFLTAALVVVPFWRGRSELISGWNFLLGGIALFVGVGSLEVATAPMRFKGVEWFEPTKSIVLWWTIATTIFIVTLLISHRYDPLSRRLASRSFNKWPPITPGLMLFVVFFCMALAIAGRVPGIARIVFIGPVLLNLSHKGMVFACVFAFVLWYRNRLNLLWLGLFIGVLLSTCFLAILASGGRRLVLSVFLAPIFVFYFYRAREWKPVKSLSIVAVAMAGVFCLSLIYSTIRHFDRRGEQAHQRDRSAAKALEAVRNISGWGWLQRFRDDALWNLSQHTVHYGMLTDHFVRNGDLEAQPFNTFKFIAVYPIPRAIWKNKPESLGRVITHKVLGRSTTWGTGIGGHSAYEGGLIIAALFGYMAAFGIRFFDDPLLRQPTNPFLIAMLAAAAMHIIAWPRGDLAVMTFEVAECFLFVIGLSVLGRFLFGTDKNWLMNRFAVPRGQAVYHAPMR